MRQLFQACRLCFNMTGIRFSTRNQSWVIRRLLPRKADFPCFEHCPDLEHDSPSKKRGVLVPPAGCDLVLKTDGLIGGVHFFPDDPADSVAKKALRVNLSDLAAKGARPVGFPV